MKKELTFLNYILYSIAFFILLPNSIKELPFMLLGLFSIVVFSRERKIDTKMFTILVLFFVVNLFSLLYTKDLFYGLKRIEGFLPLLYLAFCYCVFSKMELRFERKFVENWILIFNGSNFVFLIVVSLYFYYQNIPVTYNTIRTVFDEIPLINMHPIYLSITSVLGLMSCVFIFGNNLKKCSFLIVVNILLLFLTGARATFIGFFMILFLVLFFGRLSLKIKFSVGVVSCFLIYFLFAFNSDFKKRFQEMIIPVSYSKVNPNNSTSVRIAVWDCGIQKIKSSNTLIGNGIGDVPSVLQQCYDTQYPELEKYYNTHNQYFSILLGTGLIGLLSFLLFFVYLLVNALKNKNNFLLVLVLFYLYIFNFENIIERKYGILLLLFFLFFVFNIFTKPANKPVEIV
ncbi:O-antigen ligase family protein [Flavobacterium sp. LS2R12]|uniref:O-antigen ligase family protein n=1 Tax=unclassified Flavobacterium TaxID=196869 RepID=UPI003AAF8D52